jgi:UDP-glucose 4-epimerase
MVGVARIVNFSSECALGNVAPDRRVTEAVELKPTTVYGVTKVTGELLGSVYNALYDMQVVSLRVTEVYGPGLWMPSLLGDMIRAGIRGQSFALDAGGDHPFQFVHVDDVATAARLAARSTSLRQQAYNVSGGRQISVSDTAALLEKLIPGAHYDIGPGLLPAWDHMGEFDLTAAARDLGYTPAWDLERGLAAQIDWIKATS